ncbi:MAG: polyprenyl diphosphate synthase [Bacteroidales bacterium]|nr:polyprenyl diphosphate synthase [Bacteroidales bacterium]
MEYPRHVTIIMDGNGRWAGKQGKQRLLGHNAGVESVRSCCEYAARHGIEYLSIYAFSEENWARPEDEVSGLMKIMVKAVKSEADTFMKHNMRFLVIGNRNHLPSDVLEAADELQRRTSGNTGTTVVVMLSYSGRWDIVQAARKYAQRCLENGGLVDLGENEFAGLLSTADIPEPDLMIRTSGEQRISNYMLWQCAYTEFYFTDVLWPDFREKDFDLAIQSFNQRQRRYGKV